jgi:hypothetical protein
VHFSERLFCVHFSEKISLRALLGRVVCGVHFSEKGSFAIAPGRLFACTSPERCFLLFSGSLILPSQGFWSRPWFPLRKGCFLLHFSERGVLRASRKRAFCDTSRKERFALLLLEKSVFCGKTLLGKKAFCVYFSERVSVCVYFSERLFGVSIQERSVKSRNMIRN